MANRTLCVLFAALSLGGCPAPEQANETARNSPTASSADEAALKIPSEFPQLESGDAYDGIIVTYDYRIVPVKYEKIGDYAVVGGDMIIGKHDQMQQRWALFTELRSGNLSAARLSPTIRQSVNMLADQAADAGSTLLSPQYAQRLIRTLGWATLDPPWPSRIIAYDVELKIQSNPNDPRNSNIQKAVQLWNSHQIIELRPASQASAADRQRGVLLFIDHFVADDLFACMSDVGYHPFNGYQAIHINPKCGDGNIAHEIGHALGLLHEHQRTDRATFLNINQSVPIDTRNYGPMPGRPLGPHNLCSIMHYGADTTYPQPDWFTLTSAGNREHQSCAAAMPARDDCRDVGQRCQLSPGDVGAIRALYPR